jgi:hypothetical protein
MGEAMGIDGSPEALAAKDNAISGDNDEQQGVKTDVDGVFADGEKMGMPVFNVSKDEFYQNMKFGRKRLRLSTGSKGQEYMQKTQYNRPFWLAHDDNGQVWTRKVR